jgi:hypothetical protein
MPLSWHARSLLKFPFLLLALRSAAASFSSDRFYPKEHVTELNSLLSRHVHIDAQAGFCLPAVGC